MIKATITTKARITAFALCLTGILLCGASWAGTLQGTAMYRERIALPPDAVFEAELQDISRADAPAVVLGRARLDPAGQTPFYFEITYDDAAVQPGHSYAVRAIVTHGQRLLFTTDRVCPVLDGSGKPLEMLLVSARAAENRVCSPGWYREIEKKVPTGDAQAHGPDIGSDEWKSVVEFKLGVRGRPDVPKRGSEEWCRYIDGLIGLNTSILPEK